MGLRYILALLLSVVGIILTDTFLTELTGQELIEVTGIVSVTSQRKVGSVFENQLSFAGSERCVLLVQRGKSISL